MLKHFAYGVPLLACLGAAGVMVSRVTQPVTPVEVQMASDGAFRDGLYTGRFAAESGRPSRPAIGRWSNESDRVSFAAGYVRGYNEALARAKQNQ